MAQVKLREMISRIVFRKSFQLDSKALYPWTIL